MTERADQGRGRLSSRVRPQAYDLRLAVDPRSEVFEGSVEISLRLVDREGAIVLHACGLEIASAVILLGDQELKPDVRLDPERETLTLRSARPLPPGELRLRIDYSGRIRDDLRGLYGFEAAGERYAVSHCQPSDARSIVPCFDEPAFKARWRIRVTAPAGSQVLSNAPVESRTSEGDRQVVQFASTPPLASYLIAIAVGRFTCSIARWVGSVEIRVWFVPGKGHLCDFALDVAEQALKALERYFDSPYPFAKLDLVAVPEFAAGAMENAGAVFFRETTLLLDPSSASEDERKTIAVVLTHELSHMWFGNLVTLEWWDDLWLNEAFATWMAYVVMDEWRPSWNLWQDFEHQRANALSSDALDNTHAVYAPVRTVAEAFENFDEITYQKGGSVVRMLEYYLGAEAFRAGVRLYMERHAGGNATAADLWDALEAGSGQEVSRIANDWICVPGFPLVRATGPSGSEHAVRVTQEPFHTNRDAPREETRTLWSVPIVVKSVSGGSSSESRLLLQEESSLVSVVDHAECFYLNPGAGAFYRVRYDDDSRDRIFDHLHDALTPADRMALLGDQWALVRACQSDIGGYLSLVERLRGEREPEVLKSAASGLGAIQRLVIEHGSADARAFKAWVAGCFGAAFREVGWDSAPGERPGSQLYRSMLLKLVGEIAEAPEVVAEATERFQQLLLEPAALDPNLLDSTVELAARVGDEATHDQFLQAMCDAPTPQMRRRLLLGLASFTTPETIARTLAATLTPRIPSQDVGFLLMRLMRNAESAEPTWQFITSRWNDVRPRISVMVLSRVVEATTALRTREYARSVAAFFESHPVPEANRALEQTLELFRLNEALRDHCSAELAAWLQSRALTSVTDRSR